MKRIVFLLLIAGLLVGCAVAPVSVLKDKGIKVAVTLEGVSFYEKFECSKGQDDQTVCQFAQLRNDELAQKTRYAFKEKFLEQLQANGVEMKASGAPKLVIKMIYFTNPVKGSLMEKEARSLQIQMLLFIKDSESPALVKTRAASTEVLQNSSKEGDEMEIAAKQRHARLLAAQLGNDLANFFANEK